MGVLDKVRVMIYRVHEKGLEIFLMNNEMTNDPEVWHLPQGINSSSNALHTMGKEVIDLDEVPDDFGQSHKMIAVEGDWHDIPSIRGMLKHDLKLAKKIVKEHLPGSEKGGFFAVKEAFKKVLPHEYEAIKELSEILRDRNTLKNM
ncbi:MAG: hypothetical protein KDC49_18545 [Saprospiraceae bacterium]|nr:hypothetical protein [Saprospiraceae bacterium]